MKNALTVYIDFKSPYAYLAIQPTRKMASALNISINWLPFVLDIPSYLGTAKLNASGAVAEQSRSKTQWSGVKYAYYDCRRYANLSSMTIRGTVKIWDTNLAAVGMLWAKQQGGAILDRYIDAVYLPFWKRELDVEDIEVIKAVLTRAGAKLSGFDDFARDDGAQQNEQLQESAFEQGVFGVPTYVIGDDRYFGREHLPRIRWQLEGGHGEAPDIAYQLLPGDTVAPATRRILDVGIGLDAPESYLAMEPILAMAQALNLDVRWHAISKGKSSTVPDATDQSRGGRHRRFRTLNRADDRLRYQSAEMIHAKAESLMAQKIERNNIALRPEALDTPLGESGYVGSPVFRVGDEIYVGRQHLPLIRARFLAEQN
jgi:2-hydroxychromene-2-carboxylate isomerase